MCVGARRERGGQTSNAPVLPSSGTRRHNNQLWWKHAHDPRPLRGPDQSTRSTGTLAHRRVSVSVATVVVVVVNVALFSSHTHTRGQRLRPTDVDSRKSGPERRRTDRAQLLGRSMGAACTVPHPLAIAVAFRVFERRRAFCYKSTCASSRETLVSATRGSQRKTTAGASD